MSSPASRKRNGRRSCCEGFDYACRGRKPGNSRGASRQELADVARALVRFAWKDSGVSSLTVGCADCDLPLYRALGFSLSLGNIQAFEG